MGTRVVSLFKVVNRDLQMLFAIGAVTFALMSLATPLSGKTNPILTPFSFLLQAAVFGLPSLLFSYHGKLRNAEETRIARILALAIIAVAAPGLYFLHSPLRTDGCTWCLLTIGVLCFQVWQDRRSKEII